MAQKIWNCKRAVKTLIPKWIVVYRMTDYLPRKLINWTKYYFLKIQALCKWIILSPLLPEKSILLDKERHFRGVSSLLCLMFFLPPPPFFSFFPEPIYFPRWSSNQSIMQNIYYCKDPNLGFMTGRIRKFISVYTVQILEI